MIGGGREKFIAADVRHRLVMSKINALDLTTEYLQFQRWPALDGVTVELRGDGDGEILCAIGPDTHVHVAASSWKNVGAAARLLSRGHMPRVGLWDEAVWLWPSLEAAAAALRHVLPDVSVDDAVCRRLAEDAADIRSAALRHPRVQHHLYSSGAISHDDPQWGRRGAISLFIDGDGGDQVEVCIPTLPVESQRERLAAETRVWGYHDHLRADLSARERAAVLRAYDALVADGSWPVPRAHSPGEDRLINSSPAHLLELLRRVQEERNQLVAENLKLESRLTIAEVAIHTAQQEDRAPIWPPACDGAEA